jgi:hypothetical protein
VLYGRRWAQVSVFALLVAGMVHAVEAQVGRGALAGRIVDPAGSAVPGATVTVGRGRHEPVANGGHRYRWELCGPEARPRNLPGSCRAERVPHRDSQRDPARDRRDSAAGPAARRRRRHRGDHGDRRRAGSSQRGLRPRSGDRQPQGGRAALQRSQLHYARQPRAGGCASAGIVATSYQRPAAAHERVSVRRDLGANTPPLGAPKTTVGAAAFGTITTAGDPRVIQLAVKFIF